MMNFIREKRKNMEYKMWNKYNEKARLNMNRYYLVLNDINGYHEEEIPSR